MGSKQNEDNNPYSSPPLASPPLKWQMPYSKDRFATVRHVLFFLVLGGLVLVILWHIAQHFK